MCRPFQMDHQNIIKMHDVYESANELYIVMDGQRTGAQLQDSRIGL